MFFPPAYAKKTHLCTVYTVMLTISVHYDMVASVMSKRIYKTHNHHVTCSKNFRGSYPGQSLCRGSCSQTPQPERAERMAGALGQQPGTLPTEPAAHLYDPAAPVI